LHCTNLSLAAPGLRGDERRASESVRLTNQR
jgi:hypothetical protein